MNANLTRNGFIAAAMMNIGGVLLFSRAFTNDAINQADPVVMSNFGLLMIVVWGLAYLAAAFAVEKLVYVVVWGLWMANHSLGAVYEQDLFAGVFYSIYGLNDLAFMLFFGWVFFSQRSNG